MPTYNKIDMLNCCRGWHDFSDDATECRVCGADEDQASVPSKAEEINPSPTFAGPPEDDADSGTVYVVTYNRDYDESASCFRNRAEAVAEIAEVFETTETPDSPGFWEEVSENYGAGDWKGFMFYTLDLETLLMTEVDHG